MNKIKDVQMSKELRDRLSSFSASKPKPNFKYVPDVYRSKDQKSKDYQIPKELWPVFDLKALTGRDRIESEPFDGSRFSYAKYVISTVKRGLVGWSNWMDSEGKVIAFDEEIHSAGDQISDAALELFPEPLLLELATAINKEARLTEEELNGLG